jgi:hypothetical protein
MAMLGLVATVNLVLRFGVELGGVVALGYWGATTPSGALERGLLGLGAPVLLIVVWALVAAPRADNELSPAQRKLIGTGLLLLTAGALAAAGQVEPAVVFGSVIAVNAALLLLIGDGPLPARVPVDPAGR